MVWSDEQGAYLDNTAASDKVKKDILDHAEDWVEQATGAEKRRLRLSIANEMKDDPHWDQSLAFTWKRYFAHARAPLTSPLISCCRLTIA